VIYDYAFVKKPYMKEIIDRLEAGVWSVLDCENYKA